MSVNFLPILIDEKVLTDKIQQLRQTLPPEKIDEAIQEAWRNDQLPAGKEQNRFSFRGFDDFDNTRFWPDADEIRFKILDAAFRQQGKNNWCETLKSADALYQFLGGFGSLWITNNGINDYGVTGSCTISPANVRRLHELFKNIDFELLRPIFDEHCKDKYYESGDSCYSPVIREKKHSWMQTIEALKDYVSALHGLVAEAAAKNKVLYMWAA